MHARVAALLLVAACGDNIVDHFPGLVTLTGPSPYPKGCAGPAANGTNFRGAEVEPWVTVDPADPGHLAASWQQDRWSNGGDAGNVTAVSTDGGATWIHGFPAFTACAGGSFERGSDPWVVFGPDGALYASSLGFNASDAHSSVLVARSTDGATWEPPAAVIDDNDPDVFNDKDSLAADDMHVYAVWDRLTGQLQPTQPIGTGAAYLARRTGDAWEPARAIFDPGVDAQTLGNVIVSLPDHSLVDVTDVITGISSNSPVGVAAAIRSTDRGDTWSQPVTIAPLDGIGVGDGKIGIRTGTDLLQVAADPHTGAVYVVWENLNGMHDGVAFSRSVDGGVTWSPPIDINGAPDVPAFEPTIAVTDNGAVGVIYYDLRGATASSFRATPWLAISVDAGETWVESALAAPFALAPANIGGEYFLGDYQGLATAGDAFVPLFVVAMSTDDPTDVLVRPEP